MRFTEHELTAALTGAAKGVLARQRKDVRRGRVDIDTVWDGLDRYQRFQLLDRLGAEILPVLVAPARRRGRQRRPERPTPTAEVRDTVESLLDEGTRRLRRAVIVTSRIGAGAGGARPRAAAQ